MRKISHGEGVERVFQSYSPLISDIKIVRRGDVRRAKLYYMRDLRGKKARIKEKLSAANKDRAEAKKAAAQKAAKAEKPAVKETVTAQEPVTGQQEQE